MLRGGLLLGVAAVLLVLALVLPARAPLFAHEYIVVGGENAWVTEPIVLAEEATVDVTLDSNLPSSPDVLVSFIHTGTGELWEWTTYGDSTATATLPAGTWTGRVGLGAAAADLDIGKLLTVSATRDPGWTLPAILLFVYALLGPIAYLIDVGVFEQKRWADTGEKA
jgi:hypothetical protein